MEITREVFAATDSYGICSNCGDSIMRGFVAIRSYADGDYYKQLYVVCSPACEYEINREDDE